MSRTYRRKNSEKFQAYEYVWIGDDVVKWFYDKNSADYRRAKKKYQSDKKIVGSGQGVPSWFVNLYCERSLRNSTKKELHQWKKNDNYEVMVPQFVRNAGMMY
jgi:hypothetical protein